MQRHEPDQASRLAYRPELDGLRAIAILSVVLAHFNLAPLPGGFAGVDMFFALSGFLITSIALSAPPGAKSLGRFYLARFWRIAPAYFVVIVVSLLLAPFVLLRWDVHRLAASALASAVFAPNAYFNNDLGYFSSAAIYTPLLHLWSLGVEAQFYVVWPLFLLAARRFAPRRVFAVVAALTLVSFAVSTAMALFDDKAAFFTLPSRLWEFGLGALVALKPIAEARPLLRVFIERVSPAALALVVAAPVLLQDDWLWPAPWALLPVLPTAWLILTPGEKRGLVMRVLSSAPMTALGRVSYSLYLVHWPIFVFGAYGRFPEAPLLVRIALFALCWPATLALNHFIEAPLRRAYRQAGGRAALAARTLVWPAAASAAALALFAPTFGAEPKFAVACRARAEGGCLMGREGVAPSVALWGDSHAGHLAKGLGDLIEAKGQALALYAMGSCPPLPGVAVAAHWFVKRGPCFKHNERTWATLVADERIKTIVLAARWSGYAENERFGGDAGTRYFLTVDGEPLNAETTRAVLSQALARVVDELVKAGKRVVLASEVPDLEFDGYRCARLAAADVCVAPREAIDARERAADEILTAAASLGAERADPRDALCDELRCVATAGGVALYRDDHHLTLEGSDYVVSRIFAGKLGD